MTPTYRLISTDKKSPGGVTHIPPRRRQHCRAAHMPVCDQCSALGAEGGTHRGDTAGAPAEPMIGLYHRFCGLASPPCTPVRPAKGPGNISIIGALPSILH